MENDSPQKTILVLPFIYYLLHNRRCPQVAVRHKTTSKADAEAAQRTAQKILYKKHFYLDKQVLPLLHHQTKMSASISRNLLVWVFQGDKQLVVEKTLPAPLGAVRLTFKWNCGKTRCLLPPIHIYLNSQY